MSSLLLRLGKKRCKWMYYSHEFIMYFLWGVSCKLVYGLMEAESTIISFEKIISKHF